MEFKNNWIIVGILWGDEGKGKIIDLLADKFDTIVRSQGGDNAGHSIVVEGIKYKLRCLPSGALHQGKNIVIGSGVVLNLETLISEIDIFNKGGFKFNLYISETAHIVLDYHIQMDILIEEVKANKKIGTTKRGIGPCYEDKINRFGIRVNNLLNYDNLYQKIELVLKFKNEIFKAFKYPTFDPKKLTDKYYALGQKIKSYITNTGLLLENKILNNSPILFEGAQGVMLCVENGTYPYVTSSSPTASIVCNVNGIRWDHQYNTLGILKAYISRVGEGPFVTELFDDQANYIREKGHEYGTVTKRPRRVGWLDLVLLKYSIRVSSINYLAITLLDVLSGLKTIKVCTHYLYKNQKITDFPLNINILNECKPVYQELPGWNEDISQIIKYDKLPKNCLNYLKFLEDHLKIKIMMISNGPDRKNIIFNK